MHHNHNTLGVQFPLKFDQGVHPFKHFTAMFTMLRNW
jgi:hypothetical protein